MFNNNDNSEILDPAANLDPDSEYVTQEINSNVTQDSKNHDVSAFKVAVITSLAIASYITLCMYMGSVKVNNQIIVNAAPKLAASVLLGCASLPFVYMAVTPFILPAVTLYNKTK